MLFLLTVSGILLSNGDSILGQIMDSSEIKGIVTGKQQFLQWQMPGEYWRIKVTPEAYKRDLYSDP